MYIHRYICTHITYMALMYDSFIPNMHKEYKVLLAHAEAF